jgi:hypothetical protein
MLEWYRQEAEASAQRRGLTLEQLIANPNAQPTIEQPTSVQASAPLWPLGLDPAYIRKIQGR